MKKIFLIITVFILCLAASPLADKNEAKVEQVEGIYIFMFSKPIAEYEYLGTVKKSGLEMTGQSDERFKTLLKRCKKDYPKADGLIIQDVDMKKADAIAFK